MDKNILKQLKNNYEDLKIKPSANLWDQIESGLDGVQETVKKPSFQWWKYAAVIVLLISLGGLYYFNFNQTSKTKEIIVVKKPLENSFKPIKPIEPIISNENLVQSQVFTDSEAVVNNKLNSISEIPTKKTEISKNLVTIQQIIKSPEAPQIIIEKLEVPLEKYLLAEKKKASYITADDLLLGRELDKTREENNKDQRKFGVFDMSKIKGPNSLRIFGFSVISDSLSSK